MRLSACRSGSAATRLSRTAEVAAEPLLRQGTMRPRGFTLLEILVVIVIIAAVVAISPPLWSSGVSAAEHRATTRAIAQTLRLARSEAVAKRTDVGVEFNLQNHTWQLPGGRSQGKWPATMELQLVTTAAETVDEAHAYVRFYADGGSTGGRVTLKVKDRAYRVDINWLTGHVSIDDA